MLLRYSEKRKEALFMKYEWRRQEKQLYGAKTTPALVTVPTQSCIMINGEGNPNDTDFSNRVSVLYSVAYAVKMAYKKTAKGEYDDFAVYPLEGVWQKIENCELIKEKLRYTLVIRQPDFVGEDGVCAALERTKHRKPNPLLEEVRFGTCRAKPVCSFCMSARMTMSRFLSQKWTNLYTPTA